MLIPAILGVVLRVLYVLLRAALAPLVLVAVMVLSALSALGLGSWVSVFVLGMPALDYTTPLFAVLFLLALGVDYTIFLVTRAREETPGRGTRDGMLRGVGDRSGDYQCRHRDGSLVARQSRRHISVNHAMPWCVVNV